VQTNVQGKRVISIGLPFSYSIKLQIKLASFCYVCIFSYPKILYLFMNTRNMKTYFSLLMLASAFILSCGQKDPDPEKRTKAAFSLTGFENPVPSPIKFINISTNVTSTTWDFGDGGTSTDY
jgi:PKD repeat protein